MEYPVEPPGVKIENAWEKKAKIHVPPNLVL
jgi:hypothetical protein